MVAGIAAYLVAGHSWNYAATRIDDAAGEMEGYNVILYEGTAVPAQSRVDSQDRLSFAPASLASAANRYREKGAIVYQLDLVHPSRYSDPVVLGNEGYRIGVPAKGSYIEVFNSDGEDFGGSGVRNAGEIPSQDKPWHNREQSIKLTIPPLSTIYLRLKRQDGSNASFPEVNEQVEARGFAVAGEKDSTEVAAKVKKGTAKKTAAKTTTKKASKKTTAVKAPKAKATTKAKAASKTATRKRAVKTPLEEAAVNA
jgi:hypothetical protein